MLTSDFWAKYFTVYDTLNESPAYQELMTTLKKSLQVKTGDKILDLGCGTGNLAVLLAKEGAEVVGLDFSEEALAIFKKKLPGNETVKLDIASQPLPFPDDFFDKVVSNNVLYNIPREKRPAIVAEIYRVLKPGGTCVVSNVNKKYKPILIYLHSIKLKNQIDGFFATLQQVFRSLKSTLKIFYYNFIIQKKYKISSQNLMSSTEQANLLKEAGFRNISSGIKVFAKQATMHSGLK